MAKSWLQKYGTYEEEIFASAVGIVALSGGGQASATQLIKKFNSVDTVAAANDSVKLTPALIGKVQGIFNNSANALVVYPPVGEYLDGTLNGSFTIQAGKYEEFRAYATGKWDSYGGGSVAGTGDVSSNTAISVVDEVALFADVSGKLLKRSTITGMLYMTGGVLSQAIQGSQYSIGTGSLATGILKSTTATGALSIAVAGDFPTLNQNTTGTADNVTGVVAIANGGTGQITATLGFNALSPLTTRGDIIRRGVTNNERLALGTTGKFLISDGNDLVYSSSTITGSGTLALSTFTLTVPATGTAILGTGTSTHVAFWNATNTQTGDASFKWDNANKAILLNSATHTSEHISITQAASKYGISTTLNTAGYAGFLALANSSSTSISSVIGFNVFNANTAIGSVASIQMGNVTGTSALITGEYVSNTDRNFRLSLLSGNVISAFMSIIGLSKAMGFGSNNTVPTSSFSFLGNFTTIASANAMGFRLNASTYTDNSGSTTPALMHAHTIDRPTFASTTAGTTIAGGITFSIKGAPQLGTNISAITSPLAFFVEQGKSMFMDYASFGNGQYPTEMLDVVGNLKLAGQAYMPFYNISFNTTVTPNWNNSGNQTVTLTDNITLANSTNIKNGATYVLRIFQAGSGSYTITSYGSQYKFTNGVQPTLTTTIGAYDDLYFLSNGTTLTFSGIINNPI